MFRTAPPALLVALIAVAAFPGISAAAPAKDASADQLDQSRAATLLFIPGPVRTPQPVLAADLEQLPGFSVGLFSPTLGRYSPTQMMLDISQGARVASSLYKPVTPPPPGLVSTARGVNSAPGSYVQWPLLVERADAVPGNIVPGLFGQALEDAKKSATWIAYEGAPTITGTAATDTAGNVRSLMMPPPGAQDDELSKAQYLNEFVIGTLPAGGRGAGIAKRLASEQPDRLIVIVQAPPEPARTRLLTLAVHGLAGDGGVRSATTRRDGLVVATDIAPTIMKRLQVALPSDMQGQPIDGAPRMSAAQLNAMNDRLALVSGRRAPLGRSVILIGGAIIILLLLIGRLTGRYPEMSRLTQRIVGLALLWLPLMLLATAMLRPSRAAEADIAIAGSMLLALGTDRLVRWPRAPFVPVVFVTVAHGIDFLVFDGMFTGESLLGSNPLYGARFFGVGNELEAVLAVSGVIGVGAVLSDSGAPHPARWFAAAGLTLALFLGAGRLGADVGGVIYVGAAFGIAALYVARIRFTPLRVAALFALPFVGLGLIALLDAVTGGESHLTRTVFEAEGVGDLWKVADRRFSASAEGARTDGIWVIVLAALGALIWGWLKRERLFAPLSEDGADPVARRPYRAGIVGALGGTVIGALANDSGPAILIIGTIYIGTGLLYLRGRPVSGTLKV
ncbi:MAG: hypothetical protein JHD02_04005 [Thermoleophilaceae bacterium]|nr:hypothetical protein [Thermoleophilaceae bacterium]